MKLLFLCFSLLCLFSACGGNKFSTPSLETSADQLPATEVSNDFMAKVSNKSNVIWTPVFQIAWNEIFNKIVQSKVFMEKKSPVLDHLNQNQETVSVPKANYLAKAALYTPGIAEKLSSQLKGKNRFYTISNENWTEKDILAWGFFFKNVQFKNEFLPLENAIKFNNVDIKGFGFDKFKSTAHSKMGAQVKILAYFNRDTFVIQLNSTDSDDQVIMAKIEPGTDLDKTWQNVSVRLNNTPEYLQDDDVLKIPSINFDISRSYEELLWDYLKNPNWGNSYLAKALHNVRFQMTGNDNPLAEDSSKLALSSKSTSKEPKNMTFDKPFLLAIKNKKSDKPYFAMWIADPEILVGF